MRWLALIGSIAAGCYSGHAAPGAPCTPSLDNCPRNQTCALVSGEYICVEGEVADAAIATSDGSIDSPLPLIDAPVMIDAAPVAPWSLVKTAETTNTNQGLNFAASGAGHLIVLAVETPSVGAVTAVADNAGNTYVAVPIGRAVSSVGDLGLEVYYAKNSTAGATNITVTAPSVRALVMWEFANIKTTSPLDTSTKVENQAASTTPLGSAITTTQARELVISVALVDNFLSGLHAGSAFTNDRLTLGNGFAHITSNNAPAGTYQAQWDQTTSGASCGISAAFFIGP